LIENGKVLNSQLTSEVLTLEELESAAHKQGLGGLDEVETAILEPSGTISFTAKKPAPEEKRHREILTRLDQLTREIALLRLGQTPPAA
jgi:uncharacterized membrane protein YcaP (DUF421 family)